MADLSARRTAARHLADSVRLHRLALRLVRQRRTTPLLAAAYLHHSVEALESAERVLDGPSTREPPGAVGEQTLPALADAFYAGVAQPVGWSELRELAADVAARQRALERQAHRGGWRRRVWLVVLPALLLVGWAARQWGAFPTATCPVGRYYRDAAALNCVDQRRECRLQFDWGEGAPSRHLSADDFTAEWTGMLLVPEDGNYTFVLRADGEARLMLDGVAVVATAGEGAVDEHTSIMLLRAGPTPFSLRYRDRSGRAYVQLSWAGPGRPLKVMDRHDFAAMAP